jgi:hypothetical protein
MLHKSFLLFQLFKVHIDRIINQKHYILNLKEKLNHRLYKFQLNYQIKQYQQKL